MANTQDEAPLKVYLAEVRQLGDQDRQHRVNAAVKACNDAGWSYTALGRALELTTERARQMAHKYDGRDVGQLPPVPAPEMPHRPGMQVGDTSAEALRRIRAGGWEPAEPYPGLLTAFWRLRCATCGREERRRPTPRVVRCRHRPDGAGSGT